MDCARELPCGQRGLRKLRSDDRMEGRASQAEEMACSNKHQVLLGMQRRAQNGARCSMKGLRPEARNRSHKAAQTMVTSLAFTVVIVERKVTRSDLCFKVTISAAW